MPKNTACKVVMGFRSLDVTLLKITLWTTVGCPPEWFKIHVPAAAGDQVRSR